jgi:hypothetical protein
VRELPRTWWIGGWLCVLLLALLPLARRWTLDTADRQRCSFDGLAIDPRHRVRLELDHDRESSHWFCSLGCAEGWVRASRSSPTAICVTDEPTGDEIDLRQATVVQSRIVVHAGTGDRRHVFRSTEAAASHAAQFQGRILTGERRPFASLAPAEPTRKNSASSNQPGGPTALHQDAIN